MNNFCTPASDAILFVFDSGKLPAILVIQPLKAELGRFDHQRKSAETLPFDSDLNHLLRQVVDRVQHQRPTRLSPSASRSAAYAPRL